MTKPLHDDRTEVLSDLLELSRRRGWKRIEERTEEVLETDEPCWTLVAGEPELLTAPEADRLRKVAPETLDEIGLDDLVRDPSRTLSSDRVVVLLDCGSLLSGEEMEALTAALAGRPDESFALLHCNRGALNDEEDLEIFETGLRRWAVADDLAGDELSAHGIFLVGEPGDGDFLKGRLKRDRARLKRWLSATGENGSLERWRALWLLERAEEELAHAPRPAPSFAAADPEVEGAARAAREIARKRELLAPRLDADLAGLEKKLLHGLDRAVRHAAREVRKAVGREAPVLLFASDDDRLRDAVDSAVQESVEAWRDEASRELERTERELIGDMEALLSVVDWKLVNRLAPPPRGSYPQRLLEPLEGRVTGELRPLLGPDFGGSWSWHPDRSGRQRVLLHSAVAAAMTAGLVLLLRIPLALLPLLSGTAAVGTGWLGRSGLRDEAARSATSDFEREAGRDLDAAREQIERAVQDLRPLLLRTLDEPLRSLEAELGETAAETNDEPKSVVNESETDSARLRELRRRAA